MITHRNAYMNVVGTLVHHPMSCGDRYLWTLPMFHANGWTFVWIVTAAGATHVCLRKVDPAGVFASHRARDGHACCARLPTVLIGIACAPAELRRGDARAAARPDRGRAPAAATIERVEGELGWTVTHVYGLTETAPFITICEPRPEHAALPFGGARDDQGPPGRRAHHLGRAGRARRGRGTRSPTTGRRWARSWCAATW